jgi:predicted alpha/beta superfamily hydrolase
MGGIISFMLLWQYTNVFSKAACFSPAFKIDDLDYVATVERYTGPKKDVKIYIDNGGLGLEARLQSGVEDMLAVLKKKGYEENSDLFWFVDQNAEHNEAAWARRVWRSLMLFYGKK